MKIPNENIIKIALSALLLLCLFHMPYGYYQIFRLIAVVSFAILAYNEYERKNIPLVIVYMGLAFLFQPFAKIPIGRMLWNIIDVVVAVSLIVSIFIKKRFD